MKNTKSISLKEAKKALFAMEKKAEELNIGFSFCILDAMGDMLLFEKMDNAKRFSINMARAKAETSLILGSSTRKIAEIKKKRGFEIASFSGNCKTEVAGGIPLCLDGENEPLGSIGVSGPSQDIDEEVAIFGAEAIGLKIKL